MKKKLPGGEILCSGKKAMARFSVGVPSRKAYCRLLTSLKAELRPLSIVLDGVPGPLRDNSEYTVQHPSLLASLLNIVCMARGNVNPLQLMILKSYQSTLGSWQKVWY